LEQIGISPEKAAKCGSERSLVRARLCGSFEMRSLLSRPFKLAAVDRADDALRASIERPIEVDSLPGILELLKRSSQTTLLSLTSAPKAVDRGALTARRTDTPLDPELYLIYLRDARCRPRRRSLLQGWSRLSPTLRQNGQ
jgi:hypothetical protein